jgi:hypothetical protein
MTFERNKFRPSLRDKLITQARYGEITPQEAEAEAAANGLEAFGRKPELPQFDPRLESRWPIVMALAWIAWRDFELVREQSSEFRSECTYWIFREWNEPANNGTEFVLRKGWFLETWPRPSTFLLSMLAIGNELSSTIKMTVGEAETALWRALSDGHLRGEGFDSKGRLIEIPPMEWTHLKLFEDGKRDVFRYDALDRSEPYTKVRFRRDDLLRIWPAPTATIKDVTSCKRWLIDKMRASPLRKPKSKAALFTEAKNMFKTLPKRQFDVIWGEAIYESNAAAWGKAGAPSKSNRSAE